MLCLIIEDHREKRFLLKEIIQKINPEAECLIFRKPEEAFAFLAGAVVLPNIIFLNVNHSSINETECLIQLRRIKKLREILIVILSSTITEKDLAGYAALNAIVIKAPISFNTGIRMLEAIIGSYSKSGK